jgi:hypothetical protein
LATGSAISYIGDGASSVTVLRQWLEAGSFPTPYIKTEATTATRNASVAVINDIDESEWFNQSEGTFVVEFNPASLSIVGNTRLFILQNTSSTFAGLIVASTGLRFSSFINSVGAIGNTTVGSLTAGAKNKAAIQFLPTGLKVSVNGGAVVSANGDVAMSSFNQLAIGNRGGTTDFYSGTVANIIYYPTAVSDAKLQELSTL